MTKMGHMTIAATSNPKLTPLPEEKKSLTVDVLEPTLAVGFNVGVGVGANEDCEVVE